MTGDYQIFFTPTFLEQLRLANLQRNNGGPFVLAVKRDDDRRVELCELQSESRVIVNARFERPIGGNDWTQVS